MAWFRKHLGVLTTLWLCCQTVSLSALAPRYCCPAHSNDPEHRHVEDGAATHEAEAAHAHGEDCHKPAMAAADDHCPMAGANGEPCPMHRASSPSDADDCVMRGTCAAPFTALASLLWVPGIVDEPTALPFGVATSLTFVIDPSVPTATASLDSPPPRA